LSDYLVGILLRSSLCEGRVFNLDEPKKFVKWVRIQSGVDFTVHDLRRSFIVYAEKQEFGAHTLAALTNRSAPGKSANTNFASHHILMDTEKLEKPMQRITNYILGHADVSSNSASHNSTSHNSAGHNSAGQASVTTLQHKELAGPGIRFELSWKPKNQLPIPQGYLSPIFQG
jgi:hypothetical protein